MEIDSDDFAIYIAGYNDLIAELHLDYFGRVTMREIELITETDTIIGDILSHEVRFLKTGEIINFKEGRGDYQCREVEHFLDILNKKCDNNSNIDHAVKVLRLT